VKASRCEQFSSGKGRSLGPEAPHQLAYTRLRAIVVIHGATRLARLLSSRFARSEEERGSRGTGERRPGAGISLHTVNTHLRRVFAKLDAPNRVALAAVVHHSIE